MKVLVKIHGSPEHRFLVKLQEQALVKDVENLVSKGNNLKAIELALSKGAFLKEVSEPDLPHIKADLILSEIHAYRDLSRPGLHHTNRKNR